MCVVVVVTGRRGGGGDKRTDQGSRWTVRTTKMSSRKSNENVKLEETRGQRLDLFCWGSAQTNLEVILGGMSATCKPRPHPDYPRPPLPRSSLNSPTNHTSGRLLHNDICVGLGHAQVFSMTLPLQWWGFESLRHFTVGTPSGPAVTYGK